MDGEAETFPIPGTLQRRFVTKYGYIEGIDLRQGHKEHIAESTGSITLGAVGS